MVRTASEAGKVMARTQTNIRLDDLTRQTIKRIAAEYNMSEGQVITRAVFLLDRELKTEKNKPLIENSARCK